MNVNANKSGNALKMLLRCREGQNTVRIFKKNIKFFIFHEVAKNLNLLAVTSSVEAGYETFEEICTKARKRLDVTEDKKERRQLKTLIMRSSSLKPLSANGYFDISLELITSMMSVR